MYYFKSFLEELSNNTGVPFNLLGKNDEIIYNGASIEKSKEIFINIYLGNDKATLYMDKKYEVCLSLIKYYIEIKYADLFHIREQFFIDVFQGNIVSIDKLRDNIPFLEKGCSVFFINVDGSKYEALNILKSFYSDKQTTCMLYGQDLLVIGEFTDRIQEINVIKDVLQNKLYCKCYISYGKVSFTIEEVKNAYKEAKAAMELGKKFLLKQEIYNYEDMIFEKAVSGINQKIKVEYLIEFKDKFDAFDDETLNTIEEFMKCNLNISDAAKSLYIHRNTLIYRLDKIYKDTGYDIRNFKEATIFNIAFLIWKEMK